MTLAYAHSHGDYLDQPLSMFRDGDQRFVGAILFLLLVVIGAILIRKLTSLRGYVGVLVLTLALALLLIVAVTPSFDPLHHLCAFGLLSLVASYYTAWLNLEKGRWLWLHIPLTAIILFGAAFYSYGFWQKAFILYLVLLINVQYSFLRGIPLKRGIRYTLYSGDYHPPSPRRVVYRLEREFFGKRDDESS